MTGTGIDRRKHSGSLGKEPVRGSKQYKYPVEVMANQIVQHPKRNAISKCASNP